MKLRLKIKVFPMRGRYDGPANAVPDGWMIGGAGAVCLLELLLYPHPLIFYIVKRFALMKRSENLSNTAAEETA
jgi:hypothetical protein